MFGIHGSLDGIGYQGDCVGNLIDRFSLGQRIAAGILHDHGGLEIHEISLRILQEGLYLLESMFP